jgi:hypothetical protein
MTRQKKRKKKPTAIQKRANNRSALARFSPAKLWRRLPLTFPVDPDLPPSPKRRYRSHYRYLGPGPLKSTHALANLSPFDISLLLWNYSPLEANRTECHTERAVNPGCYH